MLAAIAGTLLPLSEQFGIVAAAEIDQATLEARLVAEARATSAIGVPPLLVTAWGRVPAVPPAAVGAIT